MAFDDVKFLLYHDFKKGFELGKADAPSSTARAVASLPSKIPVTASWQIDTVLYEDQTNTDYLDLSGGSCALYGKPIDSAEAATTLATGSLGSTPAQGESTFLVIKSKVPDEWAAFSAVRVWAEYTLSNQQPIWWQDLQFIDMENDYSANYPESKNIATSYITVTNSDSPYTATAWPGRVVYLIDTSGGAVTFNLHSAATYAGTEIIIALADATANATITPDGAETINAVAGSQALTTIGDNLHLVPYSSNWINLNPSLAIA